MKLFSLDFLVEAHEAGSALGHGLVDVGEVTAAAGISAVEVAL